MLALLLLLYALHSRRVRARKSMRHRFAADRELDDPVHVVCVVFLILRTLESTDFLNQLSSVT